MSKIELPKGITIRTHNKSEAIQIFFMYRNVRCREVLQIPPTPANIKKAFNKRNLILAEIEAKTFEYEKHFPNSPKVDLFSGRDRKLTVGDLLTRQLNDYQMTYEKGNLAISTLKTYKSSISVLNKYFANILADALSIVDIKAWLNQEGLNNITSKVIKTRLAMLNLVLEEAKCDNLIKTNPVSEISQVSITKQINKISTKSDYVVEPFNNEEKNLIISAADGQMKNLIQFNFWTGLRISELIALQWSDIDFENGFINIKRARVGGLIKTTKTKAGTRKILLLKPAREALENQLLITQEKEFIFNNPRINKEWTFSAVLGKYWRAILKKSGVKYRNQYQMRHTYASTLISQGENIFWLATQMGHENTKMIIQHYGKWIPQNEKNGYAVKGDYI